jgi:uncharacterized membrane protein YbhN (UPF0104 family)
MCWWLFTAICLAGLAAAAILSMYGKIKNLPFAGILTDFADRKTSGKVSRIINACDLYSDKKSALCFWMLITALIHLAPAFSMMFLLNGCGASGIILLAAIPAVVIGNIAGIIPLFPGGIGARDAITIALLTAAGCSLENAIAAQLLATGMLIIFNLTGALFFIFDRKRPEAIQ